MKKTDIIYYLKCQTVCFECRKILNEFEGPARITIWDLCSECWSQYEISGALPKRFEKGMGNGTFKEISQHSGREEDFDFNI